MYKVEIDISDWGDDEKLTIETSDFDKVQVIQEFVAFQKEHGWAVEYEAIVEDEEEEVEIEEEEEDEPATVSTYIITKIEE